VAGAAAAFGAPKLKPPVVPVVAPVFDGAAAVVVFVVALVVEVDELPPKENPPEVPEKGLLAGGWENENDADLPRVEPVVVEGVEPNIFAARMCGMNAEQGRW